MLVWVHSQFGGVRLSHRIGFWSVFPVDGVSHVEEKGSVDVITCLSESSYSIFSLVNDH